MMEPLVKVEKLCKQYPNTENKALSQISFEVFPGEVFSLLGPNGAGKTTTISILTGLLAATTGEAQLNGYSINSQAELAKRHIGVVPQEIALYPMISVRENLVFFGKIYGLRGKALTANIKRVLAQVNLLERQDVVVNQLSGGMQRRLNIAVALLHSPKVLFMDEPTVGIDPQNRIYILDTIKDLRQQGMSILYTSHYMEEVEEISDRIGVIDHGEIIALGTHQALLNQIQELHTVSFDVDTSNSIQSINFDTIDWVKSVTQEQQRIQLKTNKPNEIIIPVLNKLRSIGVNLTNLSIEAPNLESVFLTLTGKRLRD